MCLSTEPPWIFLRQQRENPSSDGFEKNPGVLRFPVAPHEQGKTAEQLTLSALDSLLPLIITKIRREFGVLLKNNTGTNR